MGMNCIGGGTTEISSTSHINGFVSDVVLPRLQNKEETGALTFLSIIPGSISGLSIVTEVGKPLPDSSSFDK